MEGAIDSVFAIRSSEVMAHTRHSAGWTSLCFARLGPAESSRNSHTGADERRGTQNSGLGPFLLHGLRVSGMEAVLRADRAEVAIESFSGTSG